VLFNLVCIVMLGCGTANQDVRAEEPSTAIGDGTAEAASPAEAKVLEGLDRLPAAKATTVDNLSVVADPPYAAASGKTCRRLTLTSLRPPKATSTRLACRNARGWGFVPSVYLAPKEQ
jgi:hypothetical protein